MMRRLRGRQPHRLTTSASGSRHGASVCTAHGVPWGARSFRALVLTPVKQRRPHQGLAAREVNTMDQVIVQRRSGRTVRALHREARPERVVAGRARGGDHRPRPGWHRSVPDCPAIGGPRHGSQGWLDGGFQIGWPHTQHSRSGGGRMAGLPRLERVECCGPRRMAGVSRPGGRERSPCSGRVARLSAALTGASPEAGSRQLAAPGLSAAISVRHLRSRSITCRVASDVDL